MYAIIDCNNFYASCERLFRPDLHNKPVIVLSNNDGCVIARSNEAKALGFVMGEPYFKIKNQCLRHKVQVFSSNYVLYGDLSNRVMQVINSAWTDVSQYSIDEAFLNLESMSPNLHEAFCLSLQLQILKSTGIPTSIGIGSTKTLAKIANYLCKKELKAPVFCIHHQSSWLAKIPVGEVWGVGRKWHKKLRAYGVYTAADLAELNTHDLKNKFNISLMRTAMELNGIACCTFDENQERKSIVSSKSFGEMQTDLTNIAEALSSHVGSAYEKLRQHKLLVKKLGVYITTNRYRQDLDQYNNSLSVRLINPTDDIRLLTKIAKQTLNKIYKPGYHYKKVGVCFDELVGQDYQQYDLFHQPTEKILHKKDEFLALFDQVNNRFGRHTLKLGAQGFDKPWAMNSEMLSPRYTTQWSDLAVIKNRT
ncbi:MAG: Y-family DNA polymerase [Legionellaceae bacterium]|nr:Y-family DNA polymerase [Legionellaceae bacterium]